MTSDRKDCCSSPASIAYWFAASLVAWGLLSTIGFVWHPLHASSATTILFAMAIGCIVNWRKNRIVHCGITGPLFLIAGLTSLLADLRMIYINSTLFWTVVLAGAGIAFLVEWRYIARPEIDPVLRRAGTHNLAQTRRLSARWLERLRGRSFSDSTELIRQERDRR